LNINIDSYKWKPTQLSYLKATEILYIGEITPVWGFLHAAVW